MSNKKHHGNKLNKKVTHIARKDVRLDNNWFRAYQECIINSDKEVWVLPVSTTNKFDLITF